MSVALHTSPLLPVPHGFSTRQGGVSDGAYRSLNVSFNVGDVPERVAENIRAVAAAANVLPEQIHTAKQVHGARVLESVADASLTSADDEADALWTSAEGAAVGVRVADCLPILLVDPRARRVAAVHSGWRGTELRIASSAVRALEARGSAASGLLAAIGPSIRACCYAVSPDLARRFAAQFGQEVVRLVGDRQHLDLVRAVRDTLRASGVRGQNIDVLDECTSCLVEDFFSHRRDNAVTGRQMAFVVCRF